MVQFLHENHSKKDAQIQIIIPYFVLAKMWKNKNINTILM